MGWLSFYGLIMPQTIICNEMTAPFSIKTALKNVDGFEKEKVGSI